MSLQPPQSLMQQQLQAQHLTGAFWCVTVVMSPST